jgi:hypothetical protein
LISDEPQHAHRVTRLVQVGSRRLENALLGERAEAGHLVHAPLLGGTMQLFHRSHTEPLVKPARALGADAGKLQQFGDSRRQFLAQAFEQRAGPGVNDLGDLAGESGPMPGKASRSAPCSTMLAALRPSSPSMRAALR